MYENDQKRPTQTNCNAESCLDLKELHQQDGPGCLWVVGLLGVYVLPSPFWYVSKACMINI